MSSDATPPPDWAAMLGRDRSRWWGASWSVPEEGALPAAAGSLSAFDATLDRLETVFADSRPEVALGRAAELIATITKAPAAGMILLEGRDVTAEAWWPSRDSVPQEFRAAVRRAVRGETTSGPATPEGAFGVSSVSKPPGLHRLVDGGECRGVAIPYFGEEETGLDPEIVAPLHRMLRLMAPRFVAYQAIARAVTSRSQYERWFKTMDEQIRVLDRERQKFAAMVHQTDAAVFVADRDGVIRWTNSAFQRSYPGTKERSTWVGERVQTLSAAFGDVNGVTAGAVERALRGGRVTHEESRRQDGDETRSHYLTALPILGPDGRADEVMVMIQDLSELGVLRRSEARYRVLFERSAKAIVMVDPASRSVLLANPTACRMLGRSAADLTRLTLADIHPEGEWERLRTRYAAGFRESAFDLGECRIAAAENVEKIALVTGAAIDFEEHEAVVIEMQDVTERREVEAALERVEERLRVVVANAPVILFAIDANGIFTLSEGRGLDVLGLRPGQIVGSSVFEVYATFPDVLAAVKRGLAGEAFSSVVELGHLAFDVTYCPLREHGGEVSGLIGVATDVTQRQELEERLRQSQKMEAIGRLAGGVAHDFNNLLAAIMGHGELALRRMEAASPLRRHVEEIEKAATRGALLTRQLLSFSRREVTAPAVFDLCAAVAGMDGLLRRLIGEDIELITRAPESAVTVRADRGQIEQVVMNLAVNARDAMPRGGRMEIVVANVDGAAWLTVNDNGCGMKPDTIARVFEPFFTTKPQGKGTGLGLSTVYAIVERAGGEIDVESTPEQGSSFRIRLPAAVAEGTAPEPEPRSGDMPRGHETVLLVEDEDAVRSLTHSVLESLGYRVLEAENGREALRIFEGCAHEVDLLLTDVVMPHLGGGGLAVKLRAQAPGLRVLFMSGYTDDEIVRTGVLQDGAPFLQKPFTLDQFASLVRQVLDAPPSPIGSIDEPVSKPDDPADDRDAA